MADKPTEQTIEKKKPSLNISPMLNIELIEEVFEAENAESAELTSLYEGATDKFIVGKIIEGMIAQKDGNGVLVDIEYKSNGLIPLYEFSSHELNKFPIGCTIEVVIDRLEDEAGSVVLSYQKAKSIKAWEKISTLAKDDEPVRGIVTHKVKGGLSVDVGIPAFLPGSQVDISRVNNFDQFVGQEVICKILKINKKRGNVIISRRKYLEEQRQVDKKQALDTITEGQVVEGIVKNITNYGAFVDIGGIDGLLHITDMSWGRIGHPSELVKIADTITVKVLSFDKDHEKISLGMKQLTENPWEQIGTQYVAGASIKGTISSITDYGLFVEVEKGIEGLVHISEISWTERVTNLARHFRVSQEIEALVVSVDKNNRRMSLSIKQLAEDPWQTIAGKYKAGDKISGEISNITDFGLFVRLADGIDGLVHISDLSWTDHVTHPSERFKKGDVVEVVILSIDADNRKISLGTKQLNDDPWEHVADQYPIGKKVEGIVSKITNFGAFIKLDSGIEGLVHISELSEKEIEKVEDILQVGQKQEFKVIKVSKEDRKLGLSLRALNDKTPVAKPGAKAAPKKAAKAKEQAPSTSSLKGSLQQALATHMADDETEGKPAEKKPAEKKAAKEKPVEEKPAEEKVVEDKPAEDKPTEAVEDKPAEDKPTEAVEDKPAEDKPTEDKPTEAAEDKPADKEEE